MKPDAIRWFVCPSCEGDLRINAVESVEIEQGRLECGGCGRAYPIERGVPRFVPTDDYTDAFSRQWTRWARTQHDSINGTRIFHGRMERYTGWTAESFAGQVVVDAGCGPGGFIDVIERDARVVIGFDLSLAIDSCHELHGRRPNVHLAQGDIFSPPIRRGVADRLYTFGAVHYTPDPRRAFESLVPLVREGGEIAVWVYRKRAIPQPTYVMRALTAGLKEPWATRFVEWYVPLAMRASGALASVPRIGSFLRRAIPVADYRDRLELTDEQYREWALMDTHDMLIPKYTYPQRERDLRRWMKDLEAVRFPSQRDVAAVARRPRTRQAA